MSKRTILYVAKDDEIRIIPGSGERNLMAAVINRAISDLQKLKQINSYRASFRPHIYNFGTQARSWFLGTSYGGKGKTPVTFEMAITALDLDKKQVLRYLNKLGLLSDSPNSPKK